jgi:hypothetical protein
MNIVNKPNKTKGPEMNLLIMNICVQNVRYMNNGVVVEKNKEWKLQNEWTIRKIRRIMNNLEIFKIDNE